MIPRAVSPDKPNFAFPMGGGGLEDEEESSEAGVDEGVLRADGNVGPSGIALVLVAKLVTWKQLRRRIRACGACPPDAHAARGRLPSGEPPPL